MEYIVEKILRRRMKEGKVEYRVKWQDYATSENSWVSQQDAQNCAEMIDDFESLCFSSIIGVKKNVVGQIYYAIEYRDNFKSEWKRNDLVKRKWALPLAQYLENIIEFRANNQTITENVQETDISNLKGKPSRILQCSDAAGELLYWCEWEFGQRRFVPSKAAKEQFVQLVIEYLENNLN